MCCTWIFLPKDINYVGIHREISFKTLGKQNMWSKNKAETDFSAKSIVVQYNNYYIYLNWNIFSFHNWPFSYPDTSKYTGRMCQHYQTGEYKFSITKATRFILHLFSVPKQSFITLYHFSNLLLTQPKETLHQILIKKIFFVAFKVLF